MKIKTTAIELRRVAEKQTLPAPWARTGITAVTPTGRRYHVWARGPLGNANPVDELGVILAQKADLELREEVLKAQLRKLGTDTAYEGTAFRATVGPVGEKTVYDNAAIREKLVLAGHKKFVDAHTRKEPTSPQVRVAARSGKEVKKGRAA